MRIVLIFCLFFNIANFSLRADDGSEVNIVVDDKKYRVYHVVCKIDKYTDIYEAKNQCFNNVKDIAFLHLMKFLNDNITCSEKNIDKTLESFEIIQENSLNEGYFAIYNFVFDKKSIDDLKKKSKNIINFDGKSNLILKVYGSNAHLLNEMFVKIYKAHKGVYYKSVNKEFLELYLVNVSLENFKEFLSSNHIKYHDFNFFKEGKQDPIVEIF